MDFHPMITSDGKQIPSIEKVVKEGEIVVLTKKTTNQGSVFCSPNEKITITGRSRLTNTKREEFRHLNTSGSVVNTSHQGDVVSEVLPAATIFTVGRVLKAPENGRIIVEIHGRSQQVPLESVAATVTKREKKQYPAILPFVGGRTEYVDHSEKIKSPFIEDAPEERRLPAKVFGLDSLNTLRKEIPPHLRVAIIKSVVDREMKRGEQQKAMTIAENLKEVLQDLSAMTGDFINKHKRKTQKLLRSVALLVNWNVK